MFYHSHIESARYYEDRLQDLVNCNWSDPDAEKVAKRAKKMKEKPPPERDRFIQKAQGKEFPELIATLRGDDGNEKAIKAATKIENALPDMFRGVGDPDIPLTNNHAERLLRKIVVHRKLWGCIRNEKGARFVDNTLSCMETWKLQGKNVFKELQKYVP